MSRLLYCLFIRLRLLAILQPSLDLRILLPFDPQLSLHNERSGEVHHGIRRSYMVSAEEFALPVLQRFFQEIHIVDHVLAHSLLRLLYITTLLVPASIQDRYAVQGPCRFGSVYPLENFVPFRIA